MKKIKIKLLLWCINKLYAYIPDQGELTINTPVESIVPGVNDWHGPKGYIASPPIKLSQGNVLYYISDTPVKVKNKVYLRKLDEAHN